MGDYLDRKTIFINEGVNCKESWKLKNTLMTVKYIFRYPGYKISEFVVIKLQKRGMYILLV